MDTVTLTHVAAILVGVAVTLVLVGSFSNNKKDASPTANGALASGNATKKKKKKKSKAGNGAGNNNGASSSSAANNNAKAAPVKEEAAKQEAVATKKKKKKKKAEQKPAENSPAAVKTVSAASASEPSSTTAAAASASMEKEATTANNAFDFSAVQQQEEEWNDAGPKKKKNRSQRPKAAKPAAAGSAGATAAAATDSITIDAKKVGMIIGPKGATMIAIQDATGCKLDVNAPSKDDKKASTKATVVLSGDKDAVKAAKNAITELVSKGFATILQSENFGEYAISVHPRYLSEIVGPGGRTIQALQKTLDVKITIPPTDWKPNAVQVGQVKPCNVGIAGSKENSKTAKAAIQALMKYHHHEVTHPGMIHEEVYVPSEFFHCVIGPRGSEIKHIRGNYKVEMYMPNSDSTTENVIVVGKKTNVDKAITHINTLMDRDAEQRDRKYDDEDY